MTTSEQQPSGGRGRVDDPESMLFVVDSPASPSARRVASLRKRILGGYGRPSPMSSAPFNLSGSLERTCPVCSGSDSPMFSMTSGDLDIGTEWDPSQLVQWVHHIHDRGCSYWLTPKAADADGGAVSVATPEGVARLARRSAKSGALRLNDQLGGRPNPVWLEWLMGFPEGWTDVEPSETP